MVEIIKGCSRFSSLIDYFVLRLQWLVIGNLKNNYLRRIIRKIVLQMEVFRVYEILNEC